MTFKVKESELKSILEEVASDLAKAFEDEREKLAKAIPEGEPEKSSESSSSSEKSSSGSEGSSGGGDAALPPPPPVGSPSPAASPSPADASAPPVAPAAVPPVDPAAPAPGGASVTPEVLHAEYLKLMQEDPAQFDMHVKALDAVKAGMAGAGTSPAPEATPAPPIPPPMDKAEQLPSSPERDGGPKVEAVHKSEIESKFEMLVKSYEAKIAGLETQIKSQAAEQVAVQEALTKFIERPMRKSVESMTQVAAPAKAGKDVSKMTKSDVTAHLARLTRNPDLKKSDRSLITNFYSGSVELASLAHLFEEKK